MADVKWIKITTDMFDNRKIKHLRRLPDGNNIVLIWVMLLTMAGRCNAGGMIFLTENIPYTPKMLADELDFEENTVQLALNALEQFNMIVCNNGYFAIAGWEEHQNEEGLAKIREQNRIRQKNWYEKQKKLQEPNVSLTLDLTLPNATDKEEDKEKEEERRKRIDYQLIADMYNEICISFPRLTVMSDKRKQSVKARLNTYTVEQFREMFEKAEASSFLKGSNNRNWQANFDWLIKDSNFAKVLEGNYDDKGNSGNSGNSSFNTDDFFNAAVNRSFTSPRTAVEREAAARMEAKEVTAPDADTLRRAEELKQMLRGG